MSYHIESDSLERAIRYAIERYRLVTERVQTEIVWSALVNFSHYRYY